jgi:hypothetical protein
MVFSSTNLSTRSFRLWLIQYTYIQPVGDFFLGIKKFRQPIKRRYLNSIGTWMGGSVKRYYSLESIVSFAQSDQERKKPIN